MGVMGDSCSKYKLTIHLFYRLSRIFYLSGVCKSKRIGLPVFGSPQGAFSSVRRITTLINLILERITVDAGTMHTC